MKSEAQRVIDAAFRPYLRGAWLILVVLVTIKVLLALAGCDCRYRCARVVTVHRCVGGGRSTFDVECRVTTDLGRMTVHSLVAEGDYVHVSENAVCSPSRWVIGCPEKP